MNDPLPNLMYNYFEHVKNPAKSTNMPKHLYVFGIRCGTLVRNMAAPFANIRACEAHTIVFGQASQSTLPGHHVTGKVP